MTIEQVNYGKIELDVVNVPESTKKAVEVTQTQHILGIKGDLPIRQWYEIESLPAVIEQLQRLYNENK